MTTCNVPFVGAFRICTLKLRNLIVFERYLAKLITWCRWRCPSWPNFWNSDNGQLISCVNPTSGSFGLDRLYRYREDISHQNNNVIVLKDWHRGIIELMDTAQIRVIHSSLTTTVNGRASTIFWYTTRRIIILWIRSSQANTYQGTLKPKRQLTFVSPILALRNLQRGLVATWTGPCPSNSSDGENTFITIFRVFFRFSSCNWRWRSRHRLINSPALCVRRSNTSTCAVTRGFLSPLNISSVFLPFSYRRASWLYIWTAGCYLWRLFGRVKICAMMFPDPTGYSIWMKLDAPSIWA